MSKVLIDTALVDGAAKSVANAQNYGVGNTWTTLGSALAGTNGMAGNPGKDASAAKFITAYTPAVQAAWKGFAALHRSTGDMSRGLTQTAKNHTKADRGSMISGGFSVVPQQQHNTFRDSVFGTTASGPLNVATPPSAAGPGKAAPRSLFETLTGTSISALDIEDYWPTGDPNLLARAAGAWKAAHDGLVDARGRLTADVKKVTDHSDAPDVDAFGGFWKRLCSGNSPNTVLNGLPQLCLSISRACGEYSEALREAQLQASNVGGNPIAAITSVAALRASLAATAGKLLQTVGAITVGALEALRKDNGAVRGDGRSKDPTRQGMQGSRSRER